MSEVKETKKPEVQPASAATEESAVLENGLARLTPEEAAEAGRRLNAIVDNVETVIIGKRQAIELVVMCLITGGHVLLEDVPGVGKTSLVAAVAKSVDCDFKRIQFT
ncbi:MAG: AAA family ATPase, partial [Oscillospiraceae bacterium]|nr:AAA family ATPase [Oscillospiraceae bacterium]